MSKPENPYAFPQTELDKVLYTHGGMTLRDYFAAAAMTGIIMQESSVEKSDKDRPYLAKTAYGIADAMLKARGE